MKSKLRLGFLCLVTLLLCSVFAQAETLTATVPISPANEVPPINGLNASGTFRVTVDVTRDSNGNITAAKMNFTGSVSFPSGVTITGLHIHEGGSNANGGVVFNTGITAALPIVLSSGTGLINRDIAAINLDVLRRMIANPAGFYLNIHSSVNPGGAMRGQLVRLEEIIAQTVTMSPAQEVPAITGFNASAVATGTFYATRNAQGQIVGGQANLSVTYDFPGATTFTGFHIHEGAAGANGGVRFDSTLNAGNTIVSPTGKGSFSFTFPITDPANIAAFTRLLTGPDGFYANLHTTVYPGGAVRGQLAKTSGTPPVLGSLSSYALQTGATSTNVTLVALPFDVTNEILINGQVAEYAHSFDNGTVNLVVPRTTPGALAVQVRDRNGLLSTPLFINVGASAGSTAAVTEAAGFANAVAAHSIASIFGSNLASQAVLNTRPALPNALDGTSVFVNGEAAPLFFVSPNQINFQVPVGTLNGSTAVVVRNRDGALAVANVTVANTAPGIFTRLSNGKGAPAAVASTDNGQTFTVSLSNADGTPVEIQAGNVVQMFGTGLRGRTGDARLTAGGVDFAPLFVGAQGSLIGLDQINFIVPTTLTGKGEIDLTVTVDGKPSNAVRVKVK